MEVDVQYINTVREEPIFSFGDHHRQLLWLKRRGGENIPIFCQSQLGQVLAPVPAQHLRMVLKITKYQYQNQGSK
jgi:hypothetical protein